MTKTANQTFSFTLILTGGIESLEQLEIGIYGAGCDDALVGMASGTAFVAFDREAESLSAAVESAIRDVRNIQGVEIDHIEPDDIVSMADIARRVGQSRESIRKYINGERGDLPFPRPISNVTGDSTRWRWSDVADWLNKTGKAESSCVQEAKFLSRLNAAFSLERLSSNEREVRQVLKLAKAVRSKQSTS